jgi:uncharacterized protein (TIGR03067 family)
MRLRVHVVKNRFLSVLLTFALAAGAATRCGAADAAAGGKADDAPPAKRARELVAVIQSGDAAKAEQFVKDTYGGDFLKMPMDAHLGFLADAHNRLGDIEVEGVDVASPTEATATVRSKATEERVGLLVRVEPDAPHRIVGIGRRPPKAPEGQASRKLTEAQALTELETYLDKLAKADAFSGVVLLAKDGKPLLLKAYGEANKDFAAPNRTDTRFNLGSMNKMFTAVAVVQLVEKGKLSVDDPLSKFLPEFPTKDAAEKIRIKHLLTHTSGLGSYFNQKFQESSRARFRTVDQMLELAKDEKLQFEPGEKWSYSNTGFLVLGKVIEKVTGQDYYEYVRQNVYRPAGMTGTDCYELDRVNPNLAVGYQKEFGKNGEVTWHNNLFDHVIRGGPAGGGYSTAEDLLRFDRALRGGKLVGPQYVKMLLSAKPELKSPDYGFGFQVDKQSGTAGHGGGFPGISSNLDIFMSDGDGSSGGEYTAVILANYGGIAPPVQYRIRDLMAAVKRGQNSGKQPVAASASEPAAKNPPKDLAALQGTWKAVAEKTAGRETGEDFTQHRLIFQGERFTVTNGERKLMSGTWKADAAAKPRSIDFTVTEGGGDNSPGATALGIFELAGGKLRWCSAEPGVTDRPTTFDTDGTNHMFIEFEREKN